VIRAGDAFPDRVLRDPEGQAHPLAPAWSSGPALIAIGHAECGTTRLALPYLQRLWARRGAGANVLAVLQEDPAGARALASELALTLPLRLDETPYEMSHVLGVQTVPTFFLVGRDGRVARTAEGYSRDDLELFADDLGSPEPLFGADEEGPRFRPG
jgi:hypothetical protein